MNVRVLSADWPPNPASFSDSCLDGMYRSESMNDCEECTGGKETNSEKSECGEFKTFLPELDKYR